MPEKIRKFYGKEYRLQFSQSIPEKEAKEFANTYAREMRFRFVKSDFYLNGNYYWVYARSKARDKQGLP